MEIRKLKINDLFKYKEYLNLNKIEFLMIDSDDFEESGTPDDSEYIEIPMNEKYKYRYFIAKIYGDELTLCRIPKEN